VSDIADEILDLLDAHAGVRCSKLHWRCACGSKLEEFRDFRPLDTYVHRRHLAEVLADVIDQAIAGGLVDLEEQLCRETGHPTPNQPAPKRKEATLR
jgi:hypothetical protein